MNTKPEFSDEELTAYLDGEVEYINVDAINKALANDPQLRRRIDDLTIDKPEIQSAFNDLLVAAPPVKIPPQRNHNKPRYSIGALVAAVVIAISFGIGWNTSHYLHVGENTGWRYYASVYQALYINSTLAHINRPETEMMTELTRVSSALGKEISLPSLVSHAQLDYKRAQVLGYMGQPLIQLAFLSSVDVPVALCIMRSGVTSNAPIKTLKMEGMSAATWDKDGYSYLLIGGSDDLLIKDVAGELAMYL